MNSVLGSGENQRCNGDLRVDALSTNYHEQTR